MATQTQTLIGMLSLVSRRLAEAEPTLTELDSQIGDGDCGTGIKKGFLAVLEKLPAFESLSVSDILKQTGMTLVSTIGGTSGAIFGTGFIKLAGALKGREEINTEDITAALEAAYDGMVMRGEGTQVGDKTMIDALRPALDALSGGLKQNKDITAVLDEAVQAAQKGSDSTIDLVARRGRASYLGERSRGHRDAGSMAIVVIFTAVRDYFVQ